MRHRIYLLLLFPAFCVGILFCVNSRFVPHIAQKGEVVYTTCFWDNPIVDDAIKTKPSTSEFVFLTTEQYRTLYSGGTVEVNGEILTSIDDNTYYALYEPEE